MAKVFVGLSGGVDSAVSAALLKEEGHHVTGAFIKIWQPEFTECTWREDRLDAMRVCVLLGIPYKEIDLSEEYKREVVDSMVTAYQNGVTPNPDVLCNLAIKFGSFMQWAQASGAEMVATGHYARAQGGQLLRGLDLQKDQSYFLHRLRSKQLQKILFPVGDLEKRDVRARASRFKIPVAKKPDSQGLCFVGAISLAEFLGRYINLQRGAVVDEHGATIGEHDGAQLYTIGQRHGFRLTHKTGEDRPRYVVRVSVAENTICVSEKRSESNTREVLVRTPHWIDETVLAGDYDIQTRYREKTVRARLENVGRDIRVHFAEPHLASPGQSLVVYDGDRCLGGGDII